MDWLKKGASGLGIALLVVGGFYVECVRPAMRSAADCDTVLTFMRITDNMDHAEAASAEQAGAFTAAIHELADQTEGDVQYGAAPSAAAALLKDTETAKVSLTRENLSQVSDDIDALVQACQQDRTK
jgi:hypothetical protein